jgi:signal transduction histidine kinase
MHEEPGSQYTPGREPSRLAEFVREHHEEIILDWQHAVSQLPSGRDLESEALTNEIPDFLFHIARMAEELATGETPQLPTGIAELHAIARHGQGFDLAQVVTEFSILRDCITRLWEHSAFEPRHLLELRMLDQAIDTAISSSVAHYVRVRDRSLQAMDQIATAALESKDLDGFLRRLLSMLVQTTAAVDTARVLLRDGGVLRVRATVGFDDERAPGSTIRLGDGLLGTVAADGRSRSLSWSAPEPAGETGTSRVPGVRGMYAVPLVDEGRVIGVAEIGSRRAHEFSDQDQRLLDSMASRATAAISQHMMRETAERTAAENARLYEQAQTAIRQSEDVLAIVSHDLRNPLGAIDLCASLLVETCSADPKSHRQLEIIRRSSSRMRRLIDDLLDTASIHAGRLALHRTLEDPAQVVLDVLDAHEPLAAERGVEIIRVLELTGAKIHCDHDRMAQVFSNLLGNAIKFCRTGDVISVRVTRDDDQARFVIADTGPGISPDELPHLFEPYWTARKRDKKGTGLGLYISKGIVDAHGGQLSVESTPGHGASFTVTLPLASES